jgi:hypothetical protein
MENVDLSTMTTQQVKEALGELVRLSVQAKGASVLIQRPDGFLASVDPAVLDLLTAEQLVPFLLSWPEDLLTQYLVEREARK